MTPQVVFCANKVYPDLQELSDQGILYLLMHDPRINIFLRADAKIMQIVHFILAFKLINIHEVSKFSLNIQG